MSLYRGETQTKYTTRPSLLPLHSPTLAVFFVSPSLWIFPLFFSPINLLFLPPLSAFSTPWSLGNKWSQKATRLFNFMWCLFPAISPSPSLPPSISLSSTYAVGVHTTQWIGEKSKVWLLGHWTVTALHYWDSYKKEREKARTWECKLCAKSCYLQMDRKVKHLEGVGVRRK